MMKRLTLVLFTISVMLSVTAFAAVSNCYIVNQQGNVTNWVPLFKGQSDPSYWLRATGSIAGNFKLVVKFDKDSGFFKKVYKATNGDAVYSEVNFPFAADWYDDSIRGPARLIVKTLDSKCTYSFTVVHAPFESQNVPRAIPDMNSVDSTLGVSGINTIQKVRVSVWIEHPYVADLDIQLIGPDNTVVTLSSDNGGTGDNYGRHCFERTIFDDTAVGYPVTGDSAPFTGSFAPEEALSAFNGKSGASVNGQWTLRVTDDTGGSTGQILC